MISLGRLVQGLRDVWLHLFRLLGHPRPENEEEKELLLWMYVYTSIHIADVMYLAVVVCRGVADPRQLFVQEL